MAYSTLANLQARLPAEKITQLCSDEGVTTVTDAVIADADAEMDCFKVTGWVDTKKAACSAALAIEALFIRHGSGKIPASVAERAERWRALLRERQGVWYGVRFEPTDKETAAELTRLRTGTAS